VTFASGKRTWMRPPRKPGTPVTTGSPPSSCCMPGNGCRIGRMPRTRCTRRSSRCGKGAEGSTFPTRIFSPPPGTPPLIISGAQLGRGKREERLTRDPLFADTELPPALAAQDAEAALARLPFEQREAVVLRIWGGLGFSEIAEATGAPADTAASRYRYGIATLRKFFDLAPS
jgi:DNA-directed RNA polymerase specialized sigma24 family protein